MQYDSSSVYDVTAVYDAAGGKHMLPAFPGPYTDPNITFRDIAPTTIVPTPAFTGPKSTGPTAVYEPAGTNHKPNNAGHPAQPANPLSWLPGRDPYRVGGNVGQPQFSNVA